MTSYNISLSWVYDPIAKTVANSSRGITTSTDPLSSSYDRNDDEARKIDVYEERVREWFLTHAHQLDVNHNAGFVVLMVCCSYVEGIEQYRAGKTSEGASQAFFIRSAQRIFTAVSIGAVPEDWSIVFQAARCGLFHAGMTKGLFNWKPKVLNPRNNDKIVDGPSGLAGPVRTWLWVENDHPHAIEFKSSSAGEREATLSPRKILGSVVRDFDAYLVSIRTPGDPLRTTFLKRFEWPL